MLNLTKLIKFSFFFHEQENILTPLGVTSWLPHSRIGIEFGSRVNCSKIKTSDMEYSGKLTPKKCMLTDFLMLKCAI